MKTLTRTSRVERKFNCYEVADHHRPIPFFRKLYSSCSTDILKGVEVKLLGQQLLLMARSFQPITECAEKYPKGLSLYSMRSYAKDSGRADVRSIPIRKWLTLEVWKDIQDGIYVSSSSQIQWNRGLRLAIRIRNWRMVCAVETEARSVKRFMSNGLLIYVVKTHPRLSNLAPYPLLGQKAVSR